MAGPFHLPGDPADVDYVYTRHGNPTWTALEAALGELEGGHCQVFASGMAAVTATMLALLNPGDTLVIASDCYFTARHFAHDHLQRLGIEVRSAPTASRELAELAGTASLLWVESPSNPMLDACDIEGLSAATHAAGGLVAVDNTTATPLGQRPLDLGADLSVASGSKGISGHSDLVLGYVAARSAELLDRVHAWRTQTGGILGPHEAWLALRSLQTLDVRHERQCATAGRLAQLLRDHPVVADVRYPGLADSPAHELAARQMRRFGSVVSFELDNAAAGRRFLDASRLIVEATSFGGTETTAELRARWGGDDVPEGLVRLSVGVDDPDALAADIEEALSAV
jgi:cystathionine gamma-lyase